MSAPNPPGGRAPAGSFQRLIEDIYFERDDERGSDKTLLWFCEEVGELICSLDYPTGSRSAARADRSTLNPAVSWELTQNHGER